MYLPAYMTFRTHLGLRAHISDVLGLFAYALLSVYSRCSYCPVTLTRGGD